MGREARAGIDRPRVVVGYPAGGSVTVPFCNSLVAMVAHERGKPLRDRLLQAVMHASGLYISDNRNVLARRFLNEQTAEWLLQIDTDIEFPPTLLETLLAEVGDRKVLAANVRLLPGPGVGYAADPRHPGVWHPITPPADRIFKVDGAATAVLLVHRAVLEAIRTDEGECWFAQIHLPFKTDDYPWVQSRFCGEDLSFCARAVACGFDTWVIQGLGLKHYKTQGLVEEEVGYGSVDA